MSTITMLLSVLKTRARSRSQIGDFRIAYGEVDLLNQQDVELVKDKTFEADSTRFMIISCLEALPITIQHYNLVNDVWVAGALVETIIQGVYSFPGKVSISIDNPSDNPSDLPYRFTAFYS